MAYTECATKIAQNIASNCAHPNVGGYTGRGVLIPVSDAPVITADAQNPRILTTIEVAEGKKVVVVDNVFGTPFTGSNTASNTDNGRVLYTKTFSMRIPLRGADVSKDIVEPLANNALGYILIAEKKDKVGDGSYEVIGYLNGLTTNGDGITRDEGANGGDILCTMSTQESWFEVVYFDTDYATTKAGFEELLTKGF